MRPVLHEVVGPDMPRPARPQAAPDRWRSGTMWRVVPVTSPCCARSLLGSAGAADAVASSTSRRPRPSRRIWRDRVDPTQGCCGAPRTIVALVGRTGSADARRDSWLSGENSPGRPWPFRAVRWALPWLVAWPGKPRHRAQAGIASRLCRAAASSPGSKASAARAPEMTTASTPAPCVAAPASTSPGSGCFAGRWRSTP